MKVSTRALYSLRLMVYLADHADREGPIKLREIAEAQRLPFKYLQQLVVPLKNAGLVASVQGKRGGYVLGRLPEETSALDVIRASIGPVEIHDCAGVERHCPILDACATRRMWDLVNERVSATLGEFSLVDLSQRDQAECCGEQAEPAGDRERRDAR